MAIKGDFLGFTFGETSSSDLGIVRVSSGDRYNENLHPSIKDKTADVPGVNGNYYFGSDFGPKNIDIEFVFDSITEEQFRKLRQVFGTKKIQKLIFDERPYKYYMAKIESPIELSYVCFDEPIKVIGAEREGLRVIERTPVTETIEGEEVITGYTITREQVTPYEYLEGTRRIYKGEGKISFICYYPFAKSVYTKLPSNIDCSSWADSSGIFSQTDYEERQLDRVIDGEIDIDDQGNKVDYIKLYNPGDIATGFRLYCPFTNHTYDKDLVLIYRVQNNPEALNPEDRWEELAYLTLKPITKLDEAEQGFLIDTNNGLITGVTQEPTQDSNGNISYFTDGILYNKFVKNGQFFKIDPTRTYESYEAMIAILNGNEDMKIFYDYIYF